MNFIAVTVELQSHTEHPINAYGLSYSAADAVVSNTGGDSKLQFRILCYGNGAIGNAFKNWVPGTKALITGDIIFNEDPAKPLDVLISTFNPNQSPETFCNQVVLGNAFFSTDEIKERKNGTVATTIGTTLDESAVTTWLYLEVPAEKKAKLESRIRSGRHICVKGHLREFRKEDSDSPYRALVANNFTTRKERVRNGHNPAEGTSAFGYTEIAPDPYLD